MGQENVVGQKNVVRLRPIYDSHVDADQAVPDEQRLLPSNVPNRVLICPNSSRIGNALRPRKIGPLSPVLPEKYPPGRGEVFWTARGVLSKLGLYPSPELGEKIPMSS